MTWRDLLIDWHEQLDRLSDLFPYADCGALARFRGNRSFLAQYIAETHDLTLAEAQEAVEDRLLPGARVAGHLRSEAQAAMMAAE